MLRAIPVCLALLALTTQSACLRDTVRGSGTIAKKDLAQSDFDRVEIGSAFDATIRRAESCSAVVFLDDNLMPYLQVSREGRTLGIRMQPGRDYRASSEGMRVEIGLPSLAGLDLSGASHARLSGFDAEQAAVELELSGASEATGKLAARELVLALSGASDITLTGAVHELKLRASGASKARLAELRVEEAGVSLSGASEATVHAATALDVTASGASDLAYLGSPRLSEKCSGASSVRKR
ncbi:MAG: DUF2807 domain-containing protein [Deltaproteobacteria bacterium]|nr:DUF2807 domain-containing protein [Deltaproteobacteria bacterium]